MDNSLEAKTGRRSFKTLDLVYTAFAVALIAVCSWISIPTAIPFTLQTFAVFLVVYLLGGRRGAIATCVYILLGAAGAPVFSGFKGGITHLLGPTGGYIIGFVFTALCMWLIQALFPRRVYVTALSMILGLLLCYLFGTVWFVKVYIADDGSRMGFAAALSVCVLPYILPDLAKIALALLIGSDRRVRRVLRSE